MKLIEIWWDEKFDRNNRPPIGRMVFALNGAGFVVTAFWDGRYWADGYNKTVFEKDAITHWISIDEQPERLTPETSDQDDVIV